MTDSTAQLEVLKKIAEVAKLAGIRGQVDEQALVFRSTFSLANNRSQLVHVRQTTQTPSGSPVVTIMSPCVTMKSGWLKGISKEQALGLLRANEKFPFARYGISSSAESDMVLASVDVLLESLDAAEFNTYMWAVASCADAYEATHGGDKY